LVFLKENAGWSLLMASVVKGLRMTAICALRSLVLVVVGLAMAGSAVAGETNGGWTMNSPRDELRPEFEYIPPDGRNGERFAISHDRREGLDGWWGKTFPVTGGTTVKFASFRRTTRVDSPRRSAVARIVWKNEKGDAVPEDRPVVPNVLTGWRPTAEAEYPADGRKLATGWTEVSEVLKVPAGATQAVVELHLQWAAGGKVEWTDISIKPVEAESRIVRLAAVHYRPESGKTAQEKREQFAPLIAKAAEQKADLIVLPETLTYFGSGKTPAEVAEPIPGPSSDYFAGLAKEHNTYIVAGLYEREEHLVYNVAVLLDPDGEVAGTYRKVALPRGEIESGVAPGNEYPVFRTRFGKLGMMVCYDGFFPEVARQLTNRGAEVIAWPVWGCNPLLASARACENQVYVVSSTYEPPERKWMLTAVWGRDGNRVATAEKWGDVIVTEVDLAAPTLWNSLGDFKSELARHRPDWGESP
jgi:predicted amidohydrolase